MMPDETHALYASTGYWVTRLARAMESDLEKRLGVHGVTRPTWAVLCAISHDGKTTPTALSSFIGIDGAAATRHLDRIVENGLVSREPSAKDRRSIDLKLTAKGKRLVRKMAADSNATNEKFLAGLTAGEADAFRGTIRTLLSHGDAVSSDI